jgi:hypothetical protein
MQNSAPATGAAGHAAPAAAAAAMIDPARPQRRSREDEVASCRSLAASDLAQAALMDTANGRMKLEHSAACWGERADLLERIDLGMSKRKTRERDAGIGDLV